MTILPAYCELPAKRQRAARRVLEREIGVPLDQTMADGALEQIWNALIFLPADEK